TFQARFNTIPHDGKGMDIGVLEETLENMKREGRRPKFIYVIPTFQNPSGTTMGEERRKRLVDLAHAYDTLIVEDDPYGRLRYGGDPVKPIIYHDSGEDGRTIHLGTLSKTLAPGFRIATVVAPPAVTKKLVIAKQSSDLCTNTFTQFIAAEYISQGHLELHLEKIKKLYGGKMHAMIQAVDDFMPKGLEWAKPEGGMFLWITMPEGCNAVSMFPKAVEKKVAYVIGTAFYANGGGERCMRLNFSYPTDEQIRIGIERLAGVIEEEIENCKSASRTS
ncbi:MAG: PLP-dependent aminotransferase family protein, partial [Candidatus Thermoplasmatota archaeon]|nr:PLP-dependent aminotransferase family protein [Candidatus Thermoplasmatota archaeon]